MQEAKTHLSAHIANLTEGDRIILCRRNRPVAEIQPLAQPADQAAAGGSRQRARGHPGHRSSIRFRITMLDSFEGRSD